MKELTTEQKAQRYDEAIEKAKEMIKAMTNIGGVAKVDDIQHIFPELKESEDERIRKDLCKAIWTYIPTEEGKEYIAWLEKQSEQKPADKVKPKFEIEEGKWYVCTQTYTLRGKIVVIKGQTYKSNQDGAIEGEDGHLFIDKIDGKALNYFKPWTIQDAKEGDVLACNEEILLFKSYSVQGRISLYCWYNGQTNNFHSKEVTDTLLTTRNKICPATKEQRDQLEKAMNDAGYTFNFEKKELKKIEQKPAWSEEDERMYRGIHNLIYSTPYCNSRKEFSDWLKSLKGLVQPKLKQEWSIYDETILKALIDHFEYKKEFNEAEDYDIILWLKSLRPQSQWKPSEEQIQALEWQVANTNESSWQGKASKELLEQLKQL